MDDIMLLCTRQITYLSNFHTTGPTSRSVGVAKMRLKDKGASELPAGTHGRQEINQKLRTAQHFGATGRKGREREKKPRPHTSGRGQLATTARGRGREEHPSLPLSTTHTHPPSSSPALPVPPMGRGNAHKSSQGSG